MTAHPGEADDEVFGKIIVHLHEIAVVYYLEQYLFHIVCLVGVIGYDMDKFFVGPLRVVAGIGKRRVFQIVLRQEAEKSLHIFQALAVAIGNEVAVAGFGGVRHGPAQLFQTYLFAGDGFYDRRPRDVHLPCFLYHEDKVGYCR